MSTDIFRRYLDLLNEAAGQAPTDFTPTHFHKNNLGGRIPLMQTPDGSFWWETTDPENPRAGKTVQPWIGNTENRSGTSTGSVDGVFKDGKPVDFPAGVTWKEFAQSADKSSTGSAPGQGGQPPPAEIPHIKPEVVEPNTNVALPSSGTFTNDMALANLAKTVKDTEAGSTVSEPEGSNQAPVTGDTRCKICGTKQKDHQNLRHTFVASDGTQPIIPAVQPGGAVKRGAAPTAPAGQAATPDVSKVTAALTAIEKILDKYKTKLKENINRLTPVDQMRTWRTLLEYSEVDEATRKTRRPTKAEIEAYLRNLPPDAPARASTTPTVAPAPAAPPNETPEQRRARLQRAAQTNIDRTATPKPKPEPSTWERFNRPGDAPTGPAQAMPYSQAAGKEASVLSKAWQGVKGAASKIASKAALPVAAAVEIYDGYKQISALPTDMPRDQYRAAVTKIVARLVEEFGLFWVGAILGGALAGAFTGGVGSVAGFLAGGAGGIAASYLLGDSVGAISDQIVDKLYGTSGAGSMTAEDRATIIQNMAIIQDFVKANPNAIDADLKARIDRVLAAGKAAGVAPGQGGQPPAPSVITPPAAPSTGTPKEGDTGKSKSGKPIIFKNGRWEYAD